MHGTNILLLLWLFGSSVAQTVQRLATGWTVLELNSGGARFFAQVHIRPGAHPASCTMVIGFFLRLKRPARGADQPHPPSAGSGFISAIPLLPLQALGGLL
jgi:hypothetical protein